MVFDDSVSYYHRVADKHGSGMPVVKLSNRTKRSGEQTQAHYKASCRFHHDTHLLLLIHCSKSVGGSAIDDSHTPQTQEEKIVELKAFDVKIYKAQIQMDQAMTAELKSLGVPFFGTRLDCIRSIDEETIDEEGVRQKWSPLVTSQDLTELQRRMINYLEDMYKE